MVDKAEREKEFKQASAAKKVSKGLPPPPRGRGIIVPWI